MQFAFTDDQLMIRESAREFLGERATIAQLRSDMALPQGYDPELWRTMATEMGWPGIAIGEADGGSGLGMVELAIVLEELGRCLYGGPFLASAGLAAAVLGEAPQSPERARRLASLAAGESAAALAVTDDSGRPGAVGVALRERAGGGLALEGHAAFVLGANAADFFVVAARDERPGRDGLALVVVDAGAPNFTVDLQLAIDLTRPYGRLAFGATVPAAVLAAGGSGAVERGLQVAQVALAAEQLGAMQAALDLTVEYTRQRVQFGRPIGSFQAVKHRLADMTVTCEAARSATYYAACVVDEYRAGTGSAAELAEAAALVKVYCSAGLHEVAGNAIQLHGGIGFTWEYDAHLFFKRARATGNLLGPPQHHRETIARLIGLDQPTESP